MSGCVFPNARQCRATSKRTGCQCRAPAESGKSVCRFHGARAGAPKGVANGNYRHGMATNDAKASRAYVSRLIRAANELAGQL